MKSNFGWPILLTAILAVVLNGCSKKTDANAEMERAASIMATAEPSPAPVPQPGQSAQTVQPTPAPEAAPSPAPAQQMSEAMVAYKAGNLEDAVTRLQKLRAKPTMTPQQHMAMNDAIAAVMTEIYALADKGDSRAIQAVKQYELLQTQQR
jgi:hypothetical protein